MLARTSSELSPWILVRADDKRAAHLNVIRDLLSRVHCPGANNHFAVPDRDVVFDEAHGRGRSELSVHDRHVMQRSGAKS
jgi:polyphosphate kinase